MALRIIKATEPMPVSNIVLTVYSQPGLGKSTLGFTAHQSLLLDFDKGAYRAAHRGDAVPVDRWSDISTMTAEDLAPYSTVVVDTAGRALDALAQDIISGNPKMGRADGTLTLQGFGSLKGRFTQWQSFLRSLGKDLVLICHMDEQRNGDDTLERIDAQGSSKNEIYKSSDAMCRIRLDQKNGRVLDFDPRQGGFGKNPAQLPIMAFPHPDINPHFLADVIAQIKDSINRMSIQQAKEIEWAEVVADASDLPAINLLLGLAKERKLVKGKKALLAERAAFLGFTFDKATGLYVYIPAPVGA